MLQISFITLYSEFPQRPLHYASYVPIQAIKITHLLNIYT